MKTEFIVFALIISLIKIPMVIACAHISTWLRIDVGPFVPFNEVGIRDACERNEAEVLLEALRDGLRDGGLARPGWAVQEHNEALVRVASPLQLVHCDHLNDALLDLLKAEELVVQHRLGVLDVVVGRSELLPRNVEYLVEIGMDLIELATVLIELLKPFDLSLDFVARGEIGDQA